MPDFADVALPVPLDRTFTYAVNGVVPAVGARVLVPFSGQRLMGVVMRVHDDPLLRPLYPDEDLGPAEERLRMFLVQYWGGPRTYSERRGHPRLRMRHAPFAIGTAERDAWLRHMRVAVDSLELPPEQEEPL